MFDNLKRFFLRKGEIPGIIDHGVLMRGNSYSSLLIQKSSGGFLESVLTSE